MAFKNFRLNVILRILTLVALSWCFNYFLGKEGYEITALIFAGILAYVSYSLIYYTESTNRKLTKFLESIRYSDFSSNFSDRKMGKSFQGLNQEFNKVIAEFQKHRSAKEEHFNYLQTVIQHINVGIIVFQDDGKVELFNNAIKQILQIRNLNYLQDLDKIQDDISGQLFRLKNGEKLLLRLFQENELKQIAILTTHFRMRGKEMRLISLQNIQNELDQKEVDSWQKLIRVLTHEITNSITPISSLAATIKDIIVSEENDKLVWNNLDNDDLESVGMAMKTIESRSNGLLSFVNTYRNLTRIPKPNFKYFPLKERFKILDQLFLSEIQEKDIKLSFKVYPNDLMITADPDLLQQVMINLIRNAIDATENIPEANIDIRAYTNMENRVFIEVSDNGPGIKPDIVDKIFMPFFTSKKSGSGIGLSLSRQILQMHKGSINVKTNVGEGSLFIITL